MNSPCKPYQEADQKLEKDNSGVYSLKTLSVEEVQTKEKECSMKRDQGMDGKVDSEDNSPVTLFDEECQSLQESVNHGMDFPQKISETEDQEKERKVDSGIHSPMGVNEEVQEMKDYDNKETISLQKISEKENEEIKGTVDSGVGDGTPETKDNDSEETDSVQEISEMKNPELEGDDDSRFFTPKTPSWEACGDTKERNSPQRLDEKKDKDKESDDDISEDEVYSLTQLFKEDVQEYEAVDNREMRYPEKIQIPKMDDKRLMIGGEWKGKLEKGDNQEVYLLTQSSKEESCKKIEGIGSRFWNSPGIDRKTNQTKRDSVRKKNFHLNKTTASTLATIPSSFYFKIKELKLPSSWETQKETKKLACGCCNKYCLYWNVCQVCDIFLCDYCFSVSHSPILQHKITRYIAFSEFGCLAHIRISKYFCLDCIRPRCEDCKKEKCRGHYLITRDFKDNIDHGKVKEENILERKRTEKQALTTQAIKSASPGTKPCCKYCHLSQEQYNLCKDCMEFFCDFCLALYHPKGHTVCKRVSFSQFACAKHKIVYRYFCDQCRKMRCDECIVFEKLCSEHASSLHKLEDHMALEKGEETTRFHFNFGEKEFESDDHGHRYGDIEPYPSERQGYLDLLQSAAEGDRKIDEKVGLNQLEEHRNGNIRIKSDECTQANKMQSMQTKSIIRQTFQTSEERCNVGHFCKFCRLKSERYNICEDCMIYFCDKCWTTYHPTHHTICRSKPFSLFGCSEHIKICSYFCDNCKTMRCSDCILINGKCSGHKITILLNHVLKEKGDFGVETQNFFSSSYQTINFLSEQLDTAENSTLLTKLQNEETLRQEFASLRFLITEKEQQMWNDLEQEYKMQRAKIRQQRRAIDLHVKEDGKLFSRSLTILETSSLLSFHFDVQEIWKRLKNLKRKIERLQSPEANSELLLASKFSLWREKQELAKSLRLRKPEELEISCLKHTVYFDDPTKPLRVGDLVTMPDSTLSSFHRMRVEIRKTVREVIWHSDCCSIDDYIANVEGKIALESNCRYLIKIFFVTTTYESNDTQRNAIPKHILVITGRDIPMDMDDEPCPHLCNIIGHQIGVQEKIRLHAMYGGKVHNPFVPINDEVISFEERRCFEQIHSSSSYPLKKSQSKKKTKRFDSLQRVSRRFYHVENVDGRFLCISAMNEYKELSLEELRLQDYTDSDLITSDSIYNLF